MVTFLSGGTGTPKVLDGAGVVFSPEETTVVANTGDDIELGGLFVSPDVDTLLFQGGGVLDRETWWGIDGDTHRTNTALADIADAAGLPGGPQYLPEEKQTNGMELANWRRFSGVDEFMTIGDRDRAVHITRTSLLQQGHTLCEATQRLADAFDVSIDILPMSNDPVASLVHTEDGTMHFQEFWVAHRGEPAVETVEFRGSSNAQPAPGVLEALSETVVVGPSNPVTSIGPMLTLPGVAEALSETTVVAVSPFLGDDAFSGPAGELMGAVDATPNTEGLATAYPFADAFVVDDTDDAVFDRPTFQTDIRIDTPDDAARVARTIEQAIEVVE
ncbi:2-phospho-L-lactate transferase [Natronorubrum daqingense]|uniref:2-phospho-L-lactate transferase n=1 Tax=Natronorubrum daqingense TaxID=588898 RepID=A0A1N7DMM8_9EURY|nr:2-phospho-L-lactate transferase [Natronorubrum daqingense]APX96068.1 2-phospho-L-lactate transferase [Natronorubrum daqingense]SIR77119.1 LPPG:FO 2-phospho-L-lactate transferase [Natronorubrum daqingense]